jgi:hypothetical protein
MKHTPLTYRPPPGVLRLGTVLTAIGGLTLIGRLFLAPGRTWANLLLVNYYLLGLGLGGVVFIALQYVSGAGWGVALRRLPEALAALIPVASAGVVVVLVAYPALYPWANPSAEDADPGAGFRHLWLSRPFFLMRALAYVALWTFFARAVVRASRRQDEDGKIGHTYTNRHLSAAFLVVFGVTCWLSSVDWVMALEPEWSSTIFGVYHFAGLFLGALAAVVILAVSLQRQGAVRGILTEDHLHDLGKLLFSFSCFWMYIWLSQYLLIWYVNNPEETSYFLRRLHGGWGFLFYLNLLLNWVVPFLVLLPAAEKRSPRVLLTMAVIILIGRWVDLYLMILPPQGGEPLKSGGIVEGGLAAGAVGVFLFAVLRALEKAPLVPINDPFLVESLPHPLGGSPAVGGNHEAVGGIHGPGQASAAGV